MNILVNRKNGTAKWEYKGKDIVVRNINIMYAFEYGKDMVMLKIKDQDSKIGFVLYDIIGEFILSYMVETGEIILENNNRIYLDNLVSIEYSKQNKKIVALTGTGENGNKLVIMDYIGKILADIPTPYGYKFYYTKNMEDEIIVVCQGISNATMDKYGRNDWNFKIDLENYYVERISITQ